MDGWFDGVVAIGAGATAVLAVIGTMVWGRTHALRRGTHARSRTDPRPPVRTSRSTFVPGVAGALILGGGVTGTIAGARPAGRLVIVCAAGLVVAATGFATRVTSLRVDAAGFAISYGLRSEARFDWTHLQEVRPPRWPLGGWAVAGAPAGHRILMPTDLVGHEDVLEEVIARAGLRFAGGSWTRAT